MASALTRQGLLQTNLGGCRNAAYGALHSVGKRQTEQPDGLENLGGAGPGKEPLPGPALGRSKGRLATGTGKTYE